MYFYRHTKRLTVTRYDYFCRLRIYDGGFRNSLLFCYKPKKQQEKIYSAMTTDELIRFVQSMHCELVKRIDADAIIIGFQGGYFHLLREKQVRIFSYIIKIFTHVAMNSLKK